MIVHRSLLVAGAFAFAAGALASEPSPFAEPDGGTALLVAQNDAAAAKPAGQIVITTSNLRASRDDFLVSEESLELAWVPLGGIGAYEVDDSVLRMARKWAAGLGR